MKTKYKSRECSTESVDFGFMSILCYYKTMYLGILFIGEVGDE